MKVLKYFIIMTCCMFLLTAMPYPPQGFAQAYRLKEITPEVKQALQNREQRFFEIRNLKAVGVLGESNTGFVQLLKISPDAPQVLLAENKDREMIYRAILEQHNMDAGDLAKIQAHFAEMQREQAFPGEQIQLPSGEWKRK